MAMLEKKTRISEIVRTHTPQDIPMREHKNIAIKVSNKVLEAARENKQINDDVKIDLLKEVLIEEGWMA